MASPESSPKHHLRVSSYDRVSSWLVSSLVVVGVTVGGLFFIYLTRQLLDEHYAVPVTPVGGKVANDGAIASVVNETIAPNEMPTPFFAQAQK